MLIECQECNNRISDKADRCPQCRASPAQFLGQRTICSECGAATHKAYAACPECGASSSHIVGSDARRAASVLKDARSSMDPSLVPYGSETAIRGSEQLHPLIKTRPLVHRFVVVVQAALLVASLLWMLGGLISAYQNYSYDRVGSLITEFWFWTGLAGYFLGLFLCGLIAYVVLGKFKVLPHTDKSGWRVLLLHFSLGVVGSACIESFLFNPAMGGMLIGSIGSVGILTRIIWWPVSLTRNLTVASALYAVASAVLTFSLAYSASVNDVTPGWSLTALMAPYLVALAFWFAIDLGYPRVFIPRYLFKRTS